MLHHRFMAVHEGSREDAREDAMARHDLIDDVFFV